jgi:uncharacterized protein
VRLILDRRYSLILSSLLWLISGSAQAKDPELEALSVTTVSGSVINYRIEVAKTPAQMQRGLMFRDSMPADQGMLFIYVPARPARMWMKNTILSLDMLFVDEDGIIINVAENTTPYSVDTISSAGPVRAVIELNAGQVATNGIAAGDRVTHPLFEKPEAN